MRGGNEYENAWDNRENRRHEWIDFIETDTSRVEPRGFRLEEKPLRWKRRHNRNRQGIHERVQHGSAEVGCLSPYHSRSREALTATNSVTVIPMSMDIPGKMAPASVLASVAFLLWCEGIES